MGYWHFIQSEDGTNLLTNPSFETGTTGWSNSGTNTIAQSSAQSKFGAYSLLCTYQDNTTLATFASLTLTAAAHYITAYVYLSSNWDGGAVRLAVANYTSVTTNSATTTTTETGKWVRLTMGITPDGGDLTGDILIQCASAPTAGRTIYVDAVNVVAADHVSTYIDGDQSGCEWNGAAHASTSIRHGLTRAGGRVIDIEETYGLGVVAMTGWGTPPVGHNITDYALLPGAELQSVKTKIRPFTLVFESSGSLDTIHTARDYLIEAFKPERWPDDPFVRLRYTGATDEVEIAAVYEGGLEGSLVGDDGVTERMVARFLAYDPYWYGIGEDAYNMTTRTVVSSVGYITRRYQGSWQALDTGTGGTVYAIAVGPDGRVYVGGAFTNRGGDANQDYIAVFDPQTGAWAALGTGMNQEVYVLRFGPDGSLYAGGFFTLAGGVANTAYIAKWDGSNWTALGTGALNGDVRGIDIAPDGTLYATGQFTQMGGIADTARIAKWNGTAWSALGTGLDSYGYEVLVASDESVYVSGAFTTANSVSCKRVAKWNGTTFEALDDGFSSGTAWCLALAEDGTLYAGGDFTRNGADTTDLTRIARWNGSIWSPLGTGMQNTVYHLHISEGLLYAGGLFNTAGGLALADYYAAWNGSTWTHINADLPGTPAVHDIKSRGYSGIGGDTIYVGYTTTGDLARAALQVVTNNGTAPAYPRFIIKRSGGTAARLEWLANETTKKRLWLNYSLIDGETLTIDFAAKTITSDFFGNVIGRALLPGSAFAAFNLRPGTNSLGLYVYETGTPTLTCNLVWREAYLSPDGAN